MVADNWKMLRFFGLQTYNKWSHINIKDVSFSTDMLLHFVRTAM